MMFDQNVIKLNPDTQQLRQSRLRKTKTALVDELESLEARLADSQNVSHMADENFGLGLDLNRFKAIFDNIPIGIHLKDKDGRVVMANRQILEWWEMMEEEAIGQSTDVIAGDSNEEILNRGKLKKRHGINRKSVSVRSVIRKERTAPIGISPSLKFRSSEMTARRPFSVRLFRTAPATN